MTKLTRIMKAVRSGEARDKGFTLIELLVVISLIMILASVSLNMYRNSVVYAREAALRSNLFFMRDAIDQYYADKGKYPESLEALVSESYIRQVPQDPFTNSTTTWQTTRPHPAATGSHPPPLVPSPCASASWPGACSVPRPSG